MLVFQRKNTRIHKNGQIHELLVLALSLVWFAGATTDCTTPVTCCNSPTTISLQAREQGGLHSLRLLAEQLGGYDLPGCEAGPCPDVVGHRALRRIRAESPERER